MKTRQKPHLLLTILVAALVGLGIAEVDRRIRQQLFDPSAGVPSAEQVAKHDERRPH